MIMEFSKLELELEQLDAINPADIRFAAMNLLARREHSRKELHTKLKRRFPDEALVEAQLQCLADENLQNDARFAKSFVRQRIAMGKGPLRVHQEMRERGLSDTEIEDALASVDVDWYALAKDVVHRKFGNTKALDIKEKARCCRFMEYRGFSSDHFRHLI